MSEKYKFLNPDAIYSTTSTIVDWIDLFTRKEYCEIVADSLQYCQRHKGLVIHGCCLMPSHLHLIVIDFYHGPSVQFALTFQAIASITPAIPCPPPTQAVINAYFFFCLTSSLRDLIVRIAPVQPSG